MNRERERESERQRQRETGGNRKMKWDKLKNEG